MCVFQNYTQQTTYLNWGNHLVLSPLKQICVFQKYTQQTIYLNWANHLVLSPPNKSVCSKTTHSKPLIWTEVTT